MKSYRPYELYKSTDIRWLNNVPQHWEVKPLFGIANERKRKNSGLVENNVLSLSYGKIVKRNVDTDFGLLPASFETYNIVRPKNIILRLSDLQNDKRSLRTGLAKEKGIITSAYVCLEVLKEYSAEYIHYLLHAYDIEKVFYSMGGGVRQSMGYDDLRRLPITLPPKTEQKTIASFLDRETAHIDALIEKKKRLIELLQEKRQAIITQAVTKGLDLNVPMKDTYVEWLEEVPEHWDLKRLKLASDIQLSNVDKKSSDDQPGVTLCNYTDVYYNERISAELDFMNATATLEQIVKFSLKANDVIITKDSEDPNDIAVPALIVENMPSVLCGYHLAVIRPKSDLMGNFIFRYFQSEVCRAYFYCSAKGQTRFGLGKQAISDVPIAMPPKEEQEVIVSFLDRETARIDVLVENTKHTVELLQERHSALITAAVTGQIDVREEVA